MMRSPLSVLFPCLLLVACATHAQVSTYGMELLGHLAYPNETLAGCWHHVDSSGREYALVGTSQGLSIVDLGNPAQPVERFKVPGPNNNWREVKTWNGFAYVGSEAIGSGITIVDLRSLPDTVYYKVWTGGPGYENQILQSHTVATYEGYLYIFGGGVLSDGAIICDLADPWNPQILSWYSTNYIHDGYIRNDTLWAAEIYQGQFSVIDVSDKTNPVLLATQPTPGQFNHNTWLSDDGRTLYTTDEQYNAPLASFDITDLDNIRLLDVYYPSQFPVREVHNVRVLDDFLVNPSYGGQLTIVDAHRPDNLIETAWAVVGNSLVWDADPYLPSGIVFATAKQEGLFIFQPEYRRAAYLEGFVTDATNGLPLNGVKVFLENTLNADTSNILGEYKTGNAEEGLFTIRAEKPGFQTLILDNIQLQTGQTTLLNLALSPVMVSAKGIGEEIPVNVSPTLFHNELTVELPQSIAAAAQRARVQIYDMSGRLVHDETLNGAVNRIDPDNRLPNGQYIMVVRDKWQRSRPVRIVKGG